MKNVVISEDKELKKLAVKEDKKTAICPSYSGVCGNLRWKM